MAESRLPPETMMPPIRCARSSSPLSVGLMLLNFVNSVLVSKCIVFDFGFFPRLIWSRAVSAERVDGGGSSLPVKPASRSLDCLGSASEQPVACNKSQALAAGKPRRRQQQTCSVPLERKLYCSAANNGKPPCSLNQQQSETGNFQMQGP